MIATDLRYCRHTHMTFFDRVYHPRYSTNDFLPASRAVRESKNKLFKVVFKEVNDTNEWAGAWVIEKKAMTRCKVFNNNGLDCFVVPLSKLTKLNYPARCEHDYN